MEWYHKAVRTQARLLQPSSPDLVATRMGLARAHRDLGDPGNAFERVAAVEATVRAGPGEGPDLSRVLLLKADLLRDAGRLEEAEMTIKEVLAHQESCFGSEDHPDVAVARHSYGSTLHDQQRIDEAHTWYS